MTFVARILRIAFLLAASGACLPARADVTKKEMAVPFPKFAPRASASVIVCSSSLSVNLTGENEGVKANPLATAAVVGSVAGEPERALQQFMRIRFLPAQLKVALGSYVGGEVRWAGDFDYAVQSDASEDFVATKKGSGEMGMLQTIVLNRVTGTAILTLAVASLPSGAHPYVYSTFYACEPDGTGSKP